MENRPERRYREELLLKGCWVRASDPRVPHRIALCGLVKPVERAPATGIVAGTNVPSQQIYIAKLINGGEIE